MKGKYDKSKFIEVLKEIPFVSYAAKKAGIARATIYRWQKSDKDFRQAVDSALIEGRGQLGDLAEMKLVEKVKEKDMGAIKFYLQHNDKRYIPKRPAYVAPSKQHLKPGDMCEACNQIQPHDPSGVLYPTVVEGVKHFIAEFADLKKRYEEVGMDPGVLLENGARGLIVDILKAKIKRDKDNLDLPLF